MDEARVGVRWARRLAVAVVVAMCAAMAPVIAGAQPSSPSSVPCPPFTTAMTPSQAASRYGLNDLIAGGNQGQGVRIAELQWGASVDQSALDDYAACVGVAPVQVVPVLVGTSTLYPPSGESMADAEMVAGLAPEVAGLYVFTGPSTGQITAESLDPMLEAALDPANTGGQLVDIISMSYNSCETSYGPTASTEAILTRAAAAGVWVLKGAGDSGSSGCAPKGDCQQGQNQAFQAVAYPSSSWYVTALGGVQFALGDPVTAAQAVWVDQAECAGTGGGPSHDFAAPPWQALLPGGLTNPARMVPDAASLAGDPGYMTLSPDGAGGFQWQGTAGDSLTGPVWAAALAIVRRNLAGRGVTIDGPLTPQLYQVAAQTWDASTHAYTSVFQDVVPVQGSPNTNDVRAVGCCDVLVGYDMTTGLGTVDFGQLADALALLDVVPAPAPAPVAPSVQPAFTG